MSLRAGGLTGLMNQPSAQVIDGSLRFNGSKSNKLTKTFGSSSNRTTWTWSGWVKKAANDKTDDQCLFGAYNANNDTDWFEFGFGGSNDHSPVDKFYWTTHSTTSGTTALLRDNSAWYHCLVTYNGIHISVYINNKLMLTSSKTGNLAINANFGHSIGMGPKSSSPRPFFGSMSQVYLIDGLSLGPGYFGFTDPLTNTWRPKKFRAEGTTVNDGTVWSGGIPGNTLSGYPATNAFNGNVSSFVYANVNTTMTWTAPKKITGQLIEVYAYAGGTHPILKVNGQSTGAVVGGTAQHNVWVDVTDLCGGNLETIQAFGQNISGTDRQSGFSAVRVDGVILTDSTTTNLDFGTNGFYLPFDGNSPIGQDKSGNGNNWTPVNFGGSAGVDQATGALPILEGAGGAVANVGVRTDAYASNLVLALPLAGSPNDVSNQINSGSTTKTVTVNNNASPISRGNFYGASFDFDGNGDRLVLSNYGSDFTFDGDFTMECWLFIDDAATVSNPNGDRQIAGVWTGSNNDWLISYSGTGSHNIFLFQLYTGGSVVVISSGVNMSTYVNKWVHLAVVRNSNSIQCYVDGVAKGTPVSNSATFGQTSNVAVGGRVGGDAHTVAGSIQDFRIYKGVAKYTSNFIPASTSPDVLPDSPSGVSGGSKLTKITDGAVAFDASGDHLAVSSSTDFAFGTGDFTVECYAYLKGHSNAPYLFDFRDNGSDTGTTNRIVMYSDSSTGIVRFWLNGSARITDSHVRRYSWNHYALVRSGSTTTLYVNGVSQGTYSDSTNYSGAPVVIGQRQGTASQSWDGFISNARILKGTALYTSNFTPPARTLTNVTNTKLLCCQSNTSGNFAAVSPATFSNDGTVWSSGVTFSPGVLSSSRGADKAFNGTIANNASTTSNNPALLTASFSTNLTSVTSLRIYSGSNSSNAYINGASGSTVSITANNWTDLTSLASGASGTISSISVVTAGDNAQLAAVEVNGCILVDGLVGEALLRAGDAAATNFNPFNTDINTVRGQETGYATLNPLDSAAPLADGNLQQGTSSGWQSSKSTIGLSSGRWYWETQNMQTAAAILGIADETASSYPSGSIFGTTGHSGGDSNPAWTWGGANYYFNASSAGTGLSNHLASDIVQYALDVDAGKLWFGRNGIWYNSSWSGGADPASGTNQTVSITTGRTYMPAGTVYNGGALWNFGQKPFKFSPPDGFQPLNAANVRPETVISRSDQYVGVKTYTGTGATRHMNIGLQPDLVWIKQRNAAVENQLFDSVRGPGKRLQSDTNNNEYSASNLLSSFNSDGFTLESSNFVNGTTSAPRNYVAWSWKAGGNKNTFNVDDVGYANASDVNMSIGGLNSSFYNQSQTWSNDLVSNNGNYFGSHTPAKAFDGNLTSTKCTSSTGTGGTLTFDLSGNNLTGTLEVVTNTGMSVAVTHSGGTTTIAAATSPDQIETLNFGSLTSISQIVVTGVSAPSNAMLYGVKLNGAVLIDSGVSVTNVPTIASTGASVGTKQGFSIVKYTGNSTANATLAHGLSEAPKFVIIKNISNSYGWAVLHTDVGTTGTTLDGSPEYYMLYLNGNAARDNWSQDTIWNPTSTTVKIDQSGGANWVNNSNSNYIMYAWHDVPGLQKFGSFTGNNSTDGTFVELGFRPALVWIKRTGSTGHWFIIDNKRRYTFNPVDEYSFADITNVYDPTNGGPSGGIADFLSNGFKLRENNAGTNESDSYIYCAWAEAPAFNLFGGQSNAR